MIVHGCSLALNEITALFDNAFERARNEFSRNDASTNLKLVIAGNPVLFYENEELLSDSVELSFKLNEKPADSLRVVRIYIDYSGWHRKLSKVLQKQIEVNKAATEKHIVEKGYRAFFDADRNTWDFYSTNERLGVRLQCGTDSTAPWEFTSPLMNFSKWISENSGKVMLHAGSLCTTGRGALVVGAGGAGKSGTVLAGLKYGLGSAGDDYTAVDCGPDCLAHAILRTVKQDPAGMSRLELQTSQELNWQGKHTFCPTELDLLAIQDNHPVNMIVLPKLGAKRSYLETGNSSEICKVLTFSTLCQLGRPYRQVLGCCANLVRMLPCYTLHLSSDPEDVADTLLTAINNVPC